MTDPAGDDLERRIRGTYINVPPHRSGMCEVCSAPTSGPHYSRCVPCENQAHLGHQLALDVVPLTWAPMAQIGTYSGQGYSDLLHYKEAGASLEERARLRALFWLAFNKHSGCLVPNHDTSPIALAFVQSTSGQRTGPHPIETDFLSMFDSSIPRTTPRYTGQVGGVRNDRRVLNPDAWEVDVQGLDGIGRVLIVDDTWVTGGHVQSVAAAFARAGVRTRALVLGRALDPSRTDHGRFLNANPSAPYDSEICPVHRVRRGSTDSCPILK